MHITRHPARPGRRRNKGGVGRKKGGHGRVGDRMEERGRRAEQGLKHLIHNIDTKKGKGGQDENHDRENNNISNMGQIIIINE